MNANPFQYIGTTITNLTNYFLVDGLANIMSALMPLTITCVGLYITMLAYLSIMGKSDDLAFDVFKHCIVVICITGLALNVGNYTTYIIGGVEALADGLTATFSKNDAGNIYKTLDTLFITGMNQVVYCFKQIELLDSGTYSFIFTAIVIFISIVSLSFISAIIIIGSKFLLTILFLLGPVFFVFACFPLTRRYFDSWTSKIFENVLVQVFGIIIITLAISIINTFIKANNIESSSGNALGSAAAILLVSGILLYLIRQIPNLAGSLAGGFASASMSIKDVVKPMQQSAKQISGAIDRWQKNAPKDGGISGRETWDQQQANKITPGNSNQSKDPVSQVVRDQIEKHNRMHR